LAPFTTHFDQEFYLDDVSNPDELQEDDEALNYAFLDSCEDEDDWLYIQEELEAYRKYIELELIDEEFLESVLYGKPPAAAAATVY